MFIYMYSYPSVKKEEHVYIMMTNKCLRILELKVYESIK